MWLLSAVVVFAGVADGVAVVFFLFVLYGFLIFLSYLCADKKRFLLLGYADNRI